MTLFFVFLTGCALMDRSPAAPRRGAQLSPVRQSSYRGVYHIHTVFSGDSKISLKDLIRAARQSRLDFVIITDHDSLKGATDYRDSRLGGPPLVIFGVENSLADGHLVTLGTPEPPPRHLSSGAVVEWAREKGGFSILAHPVSRKTPWKNPATQADGVEIYNFAHALFESSKLGLSTRAGFLSKKMFLKKFQKRPDGLLDYWDRKLETGKVTGWGAADVHLRNKWFFGWRFENEIMQLQSVTMYARAGRLDEKNILAALREGRSYTAFESRGMAEGFSFTADVKGRAVPSGGAVSLGDRPVFLIRTPERARIVLVSHGAILFEYEGREAVYPVEKAGAYRVEVYKNGGLWILSNPIYVE